jgi:23S rRNA (guanosine2251-2'-O)-methyltransferase
MPGTMSAGAQGVSAETLSENRSHFTATNAQPPGGSTGRSPAEAAANLGHATRAALLSRDVAPRSTGRARRDHNITVYGRMPVLEALLAPDLVVAKVFVSQRAQGASVEEIEAAAHARGVEVERVKDEMVAALARNGRHHQGVAADVAGSGLEPLADFIDRRHGRAYRTSVLVLDGVHNPANVGMVIRAAAAAGIDGVVVPRRGTAELGPLVIKASAGAVFRAPLLRCTTGEEAASALADPRFTVVGLRADPAAPSLFEAELRERAAYVLGNESEGVSAPVAALVDQWLRIPLASGVESLNVASAATLVAYEIARRRDVGTPASGNVAGRAPR